MADVEMTDAPTSAPATTKKGAAADGEKEGKKRFEVKKVTTDAPISAAQSPADDALVERCRALGVGHSSRQLRHLP